MSLNQNKITTAFFILLRAGLWEKTPEEISVFPLSSDEWKALYNLSVYQTVTGVIYRGIIRLSDNLLPPEEELFHWVVRIDAIERRSRQMNVVVNELYTAFAQRGICVVLQKGQSLAALYDCPSLRECGDIDFYFPDKMEKKRADLFVRQQGVRICKEADNSVWYEWKGVKVEHHTRLLDLYNPFVQNYLNRLERQVGFETVRSLQGFDTNLRVPAPLANLLMLNAHILKHALGWGIGLRQMCDMARAYSQLYGRISGQELDDLYKRVGIRKWSNLLHGFLIEYIGLPESFFPYEQREELSSLLFDMVWQSGNFGYADKRCNSSQIVWKRKLRTSQSLFRHMRFAYRYAPQEMIGIVSTLLVGQVK